MLESVIEYVTKRQLRGVKFSEMKPRLSKDMECIGLYVHVPFCKTLCPYCPYNRYPWQPDKAESYVKAVKKEIALYKEKLEDIAIRDRKSVV